MSVFFVVTNNVNVFVVTNDVTYIIVTDMYIYIPYSFVGICSRHRPVCQRGARVGQTHVRYLPDFWWRFSWSSSLCDLAF